MAEILQATASVVAKDGLAGTTVANVATAAGLQRTLVLHYFGSRDGLMSSFITEAVAAYGDQMLGGQDESVEESLGRLFGPTAYRTQADLVIWVELVARAARDESVRQRLTELWTQRWLPAVERRLQQDYPQASAEQVEQVAYALSALVEGHWYFHLQGVQGRRHHALQAARALLATLET